MLSKGVFGLTRCLILFIAYRVTGLIENHDYEFRVAAENAAGRGPWSSNSDVIRASAAPCKYISYLKVFYFANKERIFYSENAKIIIVY